jgi:hypothetical protein
MRKTVSILGTLLLLAACAPKPPPQSNYDPNLPSKWQYGTKNDELRQITISYAAITSDTPADLPNGPTPVELTLMHGDQNNSEIVTLSAKGGKLYCPFGKCKVSARFGDGSARSFNATSTHDGSTDEIDLHGKDAVFFANSVLQAPITIVAITFYKAGEQQIKFDTANINWPGYHTY